MAGLSSLMERLQVYMGVCYRRMHDNSHVTEHIVEKQPRIQNVQASVQHND